MMMHDSGGTAFVIDWDQRVFSFVKIDAEERRQVLMWIEIELDKLPGLSVWLAERQHLWAGWRRLAERRGAKALSRRVARMIAREPGEPCVASQLIVRYKHEPEIVLAAKLATRDVEVLRHRFETLALRDAFLSWLDVGNEGEKTQALSLVGLLQGRGRLAIALDVIAWVHQPNPAGTTRQTH